MLLRVGFVGGLCDLLCFCLVVLKVGVWYLLYFVCGLLVYVFVLIVDLVGVANSVVLSFFYFIVFCCWV